MAYIASKNFYSMRDKVICEALDAYPDLPTRTIARMIYKANPSLFHNIDNARACILYRKGTMGDAAKKRLKNKTYVRQSL